MKLCIYIYIYIYTYIHTHTHTHGVAFYAQHFLRFIHFHTFCCGLLQHYYACLSIIAGPYPQNILFIRSEVWTKSLYRFLGDGDVIDLETSLVKLVYY